MASGDQVTLSEVQTAYPVLTPEQIADLPSIITAVSAEIAARCPRVALRATYDETHDPAHTRTVVLRRRPVLRVARVRTDMSRVLTILYTGAGARGTVELLTSGETGALVATGLSLAAVLNGVAQTTAAVDFGTDLTLDAVAARINGAAGWSASVAPGLGAQASADLEPEPGVKSAVGGTGAGLWAYTRDLADYHLTDALDGELLLYEWRGQSYEYPAVTWGTDPRPHAVRVTYDAGLNAALPDVKRAAVIIIGDLLEATDKTGLVRTYSNAGSRYSLASPTYRWPDKAQRLLSRYRDRRFGGCH